MPASGSVIEVAPGIFWLRMGLPFALNHINLWLLRDCIDGVEGWSIVDCCIHRDEAKAQWEAIFAQELEGLPVLRLRLLLLLLLALVITVAMKVVGSLLITALLVIPTLVARPLASILLGTAVYVVLMSVWP